MNEVFTDTLVLSEKEELKILKNDTSYYLVIVENKLK